MRIKVFKAATLKDAIAQVKDELGVDAVILHTKKYRKGGFLGYKSKEIVEVTAAVEDAGMRLAGAKPAQQIPVKKPVLPKKVLAQYKTAGTEQVIPAIKIAKEIAVPAKETFVPVTSDFSKSRIIRADEGVRQELPALRQDDKQEEKIHQLENELAQMKEIIQQVMHKENVDPERISLQTALKEQEIDDSILQDMSRYMSAEDILASKDSEQAVKALSGYLPRVIRMAGGVVLKDDKAKIVALIGTTGVGKTTTLAKIAARFVLEQGISAALITADTYRISAVEQLKTYSDIIGLPLEIVYSPAELRAAIQKHRNKQLVLIDTAGRSQYNEYQMKELKDFLDVEPSIEKHLVMSATTKERDAKEIMDKFSICQPERILFTKTDETRSIGLVVNLLFKKKIALSYLTNGQSVPDDILPAKSEQLAELLLR